MQLSYTPEQNAFRAQVRAWLQANTPHSPLASYDTREGCEQLVKAIYQHVKSVQKSEQAPEDIDPRFAPAPVAGLDD